MIFRRLAPIVVAFLFAGQGQTAVIEPDAADPVFNATPRPKIAIIIDDLGNQRREGERTVALVGPVACAVLPHTPFARSIAVSAHAAGKEVLLHLPLQAAEGRLPLNRGVIRIDNTREQLAHILAANLDTVPHAVGVNNHQGSLLTRHPGHMEWLMAELKIRGNLFFVDSYTTPSSVALRVAREYGVPSARRDVFLDNDASPEAIALQFERLKRRARKHGAAIGIGHPYRATLDYLERALPALYEEGFALVPLSSILATPQERRQAPAIAAGTIAPEPDRVPPLVPLPSAR